MKEKELKSNGKNVGANGSVCAMEKTISNKTNANTGRANIARPTFEEHTTTSSKANPNLISNYQPLISKHQLLSSKFSPLTANSNAITLIALIITIIVMLILVGVTVTIALNGGLFSQAKKAVYNYGVASEKEYLQQFLASAQIDIYSGNESSNKIGEELHKKDVNHSYNWHIVQVGDTRYDEGWYFVKKGTKLGDYGEAQNSFLLNYSTGEIIELEEGGYYDLSAGDMLAITDNIIINVDSSIIDKGTNQDQDSIQQQLGENIELVNFDYNDESGLTSESFNFDGINDYIKIKYDSEEQKNTLAKNGFTFEFYGTWNGGTSYKSDGSTVERDYKGLFCYWNGNESQQAHLRFGISGDEYFLWNTGYKEVLSDFSASLLGTGGAAHNILNKLSGKVDWSKPSYVTVTLDASSPHDPIYSKYKNCDGTDATTTTETKSGKYLTMAVYVNGEPTYSGDYNVELWDELKRCIATVTIFLFRSFV